MARIADDYGAIRARLEEIRAAPEPAAPPRKPEPAAGGPAGANPNGRLTPGGNVCMLCGGVIDNQWMSSQCTGACVPHNHGVPTEGSNGEWGG